MANGFRRTLLRLLGRMPARCPLRPGLLERVALAGFAREKVSYAVEPGQRVSAYLFLPNGDGPHPAVLCIHQHNREFQLGKSEPAGLSGKPEQFTALELAKRGFVTFCPDVIGFEERQHPVLRGADYERFEAMRLLAQGSCLQAKILWDLMRALDYLTARKEVDRKRLGCLGHSLGGQEALFLAALDRRIAAAVSNCGFSSFQAIFEQAILHNPALYVPGLAAHGGLDRVLGLVAPRPFLAVAGSGDAIFPLEGVQETVRGARRAYAGAKDRLGLEIFPVGHDFAAPMRETAYAWLGRWLRPGGPAGKAKT